MLAFHKIQEMTRSWLLAYFPHDPLGAPMAHEPRVKEEGWKRSLPRPRREGGREARPHDPQPWLHPGPGRAQVWEGPRQPSRAAWSLPQTRLVEYTEHS